MSLPGPPEPPSTAAADAAARAVLADLGYDGPAVAQALGRAAQDLDVSTAPPLAAPTDPIRALAWLFLLGRTIGARRAERTLGRPRVAALRDAGWLVAADGRLRAAMRAFPYEGMLLLSDFDGPSVPELVRVSGVTPSSRKLERVSGVGAATGRVLDLGTGCGVFAVRAALGGTAVVATDINERAVELARRNARLNGVGDRVTVVAGDGMDPVPAGDFDVILANLPYVLAPERESAFMHSGHRDDAYARAILRAAAHRLAPSGAAYLMAGWALRAGEPPFRPVEDALAGFDGHAVTFVMSVMDAETYATSWSDVNPSRRRVRQWHAYLAERGLERFVLAVVAVFRHPTARGSRAIPVNGRFGPDSHAHVRRIRAAIEDGSGDLDPHDLAGRACRAVDGVRVEITRTRDGGGWSSGGATVTWPRGLPVRATVGEPTAAVLLGGDGARPGDPGVAAEMLGLVRSGFVELA